MLWVNGGHPVLPSSACLFKKQLQLLKFCELVWPSERELSDTGMIIHVFSIIFIVVELFFVWMFPLKKLFFFVNVFVTEDDCMIGVVASSDSEFRFLVLEGIFFTFSSSALK